MAGPSVAVRRVNFYKCCICKAPIGSTKGSFSTFMDNDRVTDKIGFLEIMNVEVHARFFAMGADQIVAEVFCTRCKNHLGWELAEFDASGTTQYYKGRYILKSDMLIDGRLEPKKVETPYKSSGSKL